jgi:hypothetical protein
VIFGYLLSSPFGGDGWVVHVDNLDDVVAGHVVVGVGCLFGSVWHLLPHVACLLQLGPCFQSTTSPRVAYSIMRLSAPAIPISRSTSLADSPRDLEFQKGTKRSKSTVKSTSKIGAKTGQKTTSKSKKHRKTSKLQNARRPKRVQKWTSKTAVKIRRKRFG